MISAALGLVSFIALCGAFGECAINVPNARPGPWFHWAFGAFALLAVLQS